eukprot:TRINITY_DN11515_c0_g1_i1.p1 TRINITY_DN11515_c0_g1~~TRINITY_DN11515_c0_g1_i1.p1  ORF type:complete len:566 (-),score=101.02 TRINITY_DN11515_c0_g1_i1:33-1730(-)
MPFWAFLTREARSLVNKGKFAINEARTAENRSSNSQSRAEILEAETQIAVTLNSGVSAPAKLIAIGPLSESFNDAVRSLARSSSAPIPEKPRSEPPISLVLLSVAAEFRANIPRDYYQFGHAEQGSNVMTVSSPFGCACPPSLGNLLTHGVVSLRVPVSAFNFGSNSSSSSTRSDVIIVDTKVFPGIEGSPIFMFSPAVDQYLLVGIIVSTFSSKHIPSLSVVMGSRYFKSWLESVEKAIHHHKSSSIVQRPIVVPRKQPFLEAAMSKLVSIEVAGTWASGILISSRGIVLTNSHVVQPFIKTGNPIRVRLLPRNFQRKSMASGAALWRFADVIFSSNGCWDVAFLQIKTQHSEETFVHWNTFYENTNEVQLEVDLTLGDEVFVVGYGLFNPRSVSEPWISRGVLSKRVIHRERTVALISSAAVHRGASGGMLINAVSGRLIGLVSCNLRISLNDPDNQKQTQEDDHPTTSTDSMRLFPHINLSVPISIVRDSGVRINPASGGFIAASSSWQEKLNETDEEISRIWTLADPVPDDVLNPRGRAVEAKVGELEETRKLKIPPTSKL